MLCNFVREGAVSPFSGVRWAVGEWMEGGPGAPAACRQGVHACRREDLPFWLNRELWEVELAGEIAETEYKLVAERGRLVRRINRWDRRTFRRFAEACAAQVRVLGVDEIARDCDAVIEKGAYALAVYFTAVAAERDINRWHLSLSHDGGIASAMVVAETGRVEVER